MTRWQGFQQVFFLGLVCEAVINCVPEDAGERLAAGADPQQICDETMGRVLFKYATWARSVAEQDPSRWPSALSGCDEPSSSGRSRGAQGAAE